MSIQLQWRRRKNGLVAYVYEEHREGKRQVWRCLRRATDEDLLARPVSTVVSTEAPRVSTGVATPVSTPATEPKTLGRLVDDLAQRRESRAPTQGTVRAGRGYYADPDWDDG